MSQQTGLLNQTPSNQSFSFWKKVSSIHSIRRNTQSFEQSQGGKNKDFIEEDITFRNVS